MRMLRRLLIGGTTAALTATGLALAGPSAPATTSPSRMAATMPAWWSRARAGARPAARGSDMSRNTPVYMRRPATRICSTRRWAGKTVPSERRASTSRAWPRETRSF